jgi:large subunit ribosomal protein L25
MAEVKINGTARTVFGKGASRRDRRDGNVPGVIYGHGEAPKHVALPLRELTAALKTSNVLIDISFDGKTELTLPKSVSRNPLTGALAHIDLVIVRRGERVKVEVPVHTEGKYDQDGILSHVNNTVEVEADVTNIPQFLTLDLTDMKAGETKFASDVKLPADVKLISDPHMAVAHLSERAAAEEVVAAPAAEGAAPAAEGAAAPAEGGEAAAKE